MKKYIPLLPQAISHLTMLFLFVFSVSAQQSGMINNGAHIVVTQNAEMIIAGGSSADYNNNTLGNHGTIESDGEILLEGDWFNNTALGKVFINNNGIGTVLFEGLVPLQSIGGSDITEFENLVIDKAATTGISLDTDTEIMGSIDFRDDFMLLNSSELNITNNMSSAVITSGGYAVSEQTNNSGRITRAITFSETPYLYPFGILNGPYIPFTVNPTSGTATAVTVATYGTGADNLPLPTTPDLVTNLDSKIGLAPDNSAATADRYWQIDPNINNLTADLNFTYAPSELPGNPYNDPFKIRAQRYDPDADKWQDPLAGQVVSAPYTVSVPAVNTFSPWTLSHIDAPLPVELLTFNAKKVNGKVELNWATASEKNNDFFTVERAVDALNFEVLGTVNGAGNSNTVIHYGFTDEQPFSGINYYRLKQTDFDASFTYSEIVSVNLNGTSSHEFALYPNPSEGTVFLRTGGHINGDLSLQITDMLGNIVLETVLAAANGSEIQLPLHQKPASGVYIAKIVTDDQLYTQRLVIQ